MPGDLVQFSAHSNSAEHGIRAEVGGYAYELFNGESRKKTGGLVFIKQGQVGVILENYIIVASNMCKVKFNGINVFVEAWEDDLQFVEENVNV